VLTDASILEWESFIKNLIIHKPTIGDALSELQTIPSNTLNQFSACMKHGANANTTGAEFVLGSEFDDRRPHCDRAGPGPSSGPMMARSVRHLAGKGRLRLRVR